MAGSNQGRPRRIEPLRGAWLTGRSVLPQKFIDDRKRERCAVAVAELAHEGGVQSLSLAAVVARAGIARGTFYGLFDGLDQGLEFACKLAAQRFARSIEDAAETKDVWQEQVEAAIAGFLVAVCEQPILAELHLVHRASIAGVAESPQEETSAAALVAVLQGRPELPGPLEPALAAVYELIAGGIVAVVSKRLRDGEAGSLMELREELVTLALTPSRTKQRGEWAGSNSGPQLRVVGAALD